MPHSAFRVHSLGPGIVTSQAAFISLLSQLKGYRWDFPIYLFKNGWIRDLVTGLRVRVRPQTTRCCNCQAREPGTDESEKCRQILAKWDTQLEATQSKKRQIEARAKSVYFLCESTRKQLEAKSGKTRQ